MEKHTSRWLAIFHHLLQSILNVAIALWLVAAGLITLRLAAGLGAKLVASSSTESPLQP